MKLTSAIRETKDKTPDLKTRVQEIQTRGQSRLHDMRKDSRLKSVSKAIAKRRSTRSRFGQINPIGRSRQGPADQKRKVVGAGLLGGSLVYFFDPAQGTRRRHIAADKLSSALRRGSRAAARRAQHTEKQMKGAASKATPSISSIKSSTLNDQDLAHKVESELFRDPSIPKGQININAEEGVVYLRGTIDSMEQSQQIGAQASRIDGVAGVKNLLHATSVS